MLHQVMTKPDREPVQSFGARTSYEIQVAPPPVIEAKAEPVSGTAPADPSADVVEVPPPPVIEAKAEPTISAAPVDPSADVVQVPPPPVIEHKTALITSWLFDALAVVMVMVIPVLVLIEFLFRPTFAKRVLAFGAIPSAKKFTFGKMRAAGVRGVLIYCRDYRCSQWTRLDADRWSDGVRLSDVETRLVCTACGKRGADVRPDFNWDKKPAGLMGYRS